MPGLCCWVLQQEETRSGCKSPPSIPHLQAAGIEVRERTRRGGAIDYSKEVPFERRAAAGFFDTRGEDLQRGEPGRPGQGDDAGEVALQPGCRGLALNAGGGSIAGTVQQRRAPAGSSAVPTVAHLFRMNTYGVRTPLPCECVSFSKPNPPP